MLADQGISGNVTFVAGHRVEIAGSDFDLTPYREGVLMFSNGSHDQALKLSASGGDWIGLLYAPNSLAEVSGSDDWSLTGGIVAETVRLNGSNFDIIGQIQDGGAGKQRIGLTE